MGCLVKLNAMNMLLDVSGFGKSTLLKAFSNKTGTLLTDYCVQLLFPESYFALSERSNLKSSGLHKAKEGGFLSRK